MRLNTAIDFLPKTSPLTIRRLKSLEINTFFDLINYFPFRYENLSLISPINRLQAGEIVTIRGTITKSSNLFPKKNLSIQTIEVNDGTASIKCSWYNQPYLLKILKKGALISVGGKVIAVGRKLYFEPKNYEIIGSYNEKNLIHTGRLVPVYPEKKGITSRLLREKIYWLINQITHINDHLPQEVISYNQLLDITSTYKKIHFPQNEKEIYQARRRMAFDELFIIQLSMALLKKNWQTKSGHQFILDKQKQAAIKDLINHLPFELTFDQKKALTEIFNDLKKPKPMNRFLQGEVGSGKTVVAAIACYLSYLNGYQSLLMAPTEILAVQHYQTIKNLFKKTDLKIGLLTGSQKIKNLEKKINQYHLFIGTHALLNQNLKFDKVGLVVIDEQHRFGVRQRTILQQKGKNPHLLTMTATPIPRTVALTLYGNLDLSFIEEMPRGRIPVKTFLVPKHKRLDGYNWIKKEIRQQGSQVFIICPLIEESEKETLSSVKAATEEYRYLSRQIFNQFHVGLLHGQMKAKEKNQVMNDFKNKKLDILVATSVVEVGIDISNARIMIIEGAERYGLAQLHQLRGRIGRGSEQSYCFLFTENEDESIINRLKFFSQTNSGIKLAEFDLQHRGPGEIFGAKQHGFIDLRFARLTDNQLVKQTKNAVNYFLSHYSIKNFPQLADSLKTFNFNQVTNN